MNAKQISRWALACILLSIAAVLVLLIAGYGYQWGWWELRTSFTWLLPGSGILAIVGLILAGIYGIARLRDPSRSGAAAAVIGAVLALAVIGTLGYWANEASKYPPIHDISTDVENPPPFRAIVALRAEASNDTTYGDAEKAALQREHYPELETLFLDMEYPQAFERALEAAREMPWEQIVTADEEAGLIEAVDKLPWFGFIDDVVIRVDTAETAGRSRIDVRSVSRIGQGDIGVNAHRIREYLEVVRISSD